MKKKTKAEELVAPERPHLSPSAEFGLTQAQVEAQKDAGLINTAVQSSARSVSTIVKENLFTYFNLVFLILAALVVAAGSLRSLTVLPVVIVNTLSRSFRTIALAAPLVAVAGNAAGIVASYNFEVPPGAAIIFTLTLTLILVKLVSLRSKKQRAAA